MKHPSILPLARALVPVLLVLLFCSPPAFSAEPVEVGADRVREMMDSGQAVAIFPLSPIEFNNLHIEGSINIPIDQIPASLPVDKTQALIFYCLGYT